MDRLTEKDRLMKKLVTASPILFTAVFLLIPLCSVTAWMCGYHFVQYRDSIPLLAMTALFLAATTAMLWRKAAPGRCGRVFAALLLPLLVFHSFFFLPTADWLVFACIVVSLGCGLAVFFRYANPLPWKIVCGIGAALLLLWLAFVVVLTGFGSRTVVKTIPSPGGTYTAQVTDSNEGALGGATIVEVQEEGANIHIGIGRFLKQPVCVYTGRWGEAQQMDIQWQDEETLVINGAKYPIEP